MSGRGAANGIGPAPDGIATHCHAAIPPARPYLDGRSTRDYADRLDGLADMRQEQEAEVESGLLDIGSQLGQGGWDPDPR